MPAAIVLGAVAIAGCGGGGASTTATTGASAAATKAQVRQNWTAFFNGSTPASKKTALLQNGDRYRKVIAAQSNSTLAQQTRAKVSSVALTSPTTARVKYTILVGGKPALKNRTGTAVKSNGTWKVSDASFCQLLKLEGSAPAGCPSG